MTNFKNFYHKLINFILPPTCIVCGTSVLQTGAVCSVCFKQLEFITDPFCRRCAQPFVSWDITDQTYICSNCEENPPVWRQARAAFLYNDGIRNLILPLKYADRYDGIKFLISHMRRVVASTLQEVDIIAPVPLHLSRLRQRQYNQSALLAWALGKESRVQIIPDLLIRNRKTEVLGHLTGSERRRILAGSIEVRPKYYSKIANKKILLVDDVMTTGATLEECSHVLILAGVQWVDVVVIARVGNHY